MCVMSREPSKYSLCNIFITCILSNDCPEAQDIKCSNDWVSAPSDSSLKEGWVNYSNAAFSFY